MTWTENIFQKMFFNMERKDPFKPRPERVAIRSPEGLMRRGN
jgi:hypothetical protein